MPGWIKGFGKSYRNKKDISRIESICEHCGRLGWLQSYDAREWFVFLFIPITPLKRYRILDQCHFCGRHQRLSEADFASLKQAELEPFQAALQNDPGSVETRLRLADALARLRLFRDAEAVLAEGTDRTASPGSLYFRMGELRAVQADSRGAAEAFRNAVNTGGVPLARRELGRALVASGEAAEAAQELEAARLASSRDGDTLWLLALAYDKLGRHAEASPLLEQLRTMAPELAESEEFVAVSKRAQMAPGLAASPPENKAGRRWLPSLGWRPVLAATALTVIVSGAGFLAYTRLHEKSRPAPKNRSAKVPAPHPSPASSPADSPLETARRWLGQERDADAWRSLDPLLTASDAQPEAFVLYARAAVGAGQVLPARARLGELEVTDTNRLALLTARWTLVLAAELWDEAEAMIEEREALGGGDRDATWAWRMQLAQIRDDTAEIERLLARASKSPGGRRARLEAELELALGSRRWADAATSAGALATERDADDDSALFRLYEATALLAAGESARADEIFATVRDGLAADTPGAKALGILADRLADPNRTDTASDEVLEAASSAPERIPHLFFLLALGEIGRGHENRARPLLEHAMRRALGFELPYSAVRRLANRS